MMTQLYFHFCSNIKSQLKANIVWIDRQETVDDIAKSIKEISFDNSESLVVSCSFCFFAFLKRNIAEV